MKSFIADKNRKLSKLALENIPDLTFSSLMTALKQKDVKVNNVRVNSDVMLSVGDKVDVYYVAKKINAFDVIFSDENIVVINKKSGITSENVYKLMLEQFANARFIHRLDRNTSGLMIFALNNKAEKELLIGFKDRTFEKIYTAVVVGEVKKQSDRLTAYLKKDKEKSLVSIYDNHVKESVEIKTDYKVVKREKGFTTLEVVLHTGKTHQIRAHLAHVGYPILGDGKYGDFKANEKAGVKSQMLTATKLVLHFNEQDFLYYLNGKTFII